MENFKRVISASDMKIIANFFNISMDELCSIPLKNKHLNKITESEYNLKIRTAQSEFRRNLLNKYNSCFICNLSFEPLLIASHIKPWSLCSNRERLDVNNGLLLCTHHDKLFDKGYITFINNKISVSKALPEHSLLKISNIQRNYDFNKKQEIYMKFHNSNIFLDRLDE